MKRSAMADLLYGQKKDGIALRMSDLGALPLDVKDELYEEKLQKSLDI